MNNPSQVDASPSKKLFIEMLTKDIPLIRAILDLVDNSIDGARRLRPNANYEGLWIRLDVSKNRFKISDNCGGMDVKTAREYAFRFGRRDDAPETPGSVGQFGVGMKRAFFKIGKFFSVESKTTDNSFLLEVDVHEWQKKAEWTFEFKEFDENANNSLDSVGTRLCVTNLHQNVSVNFSQDNFVKKLAQELSTAYLLSMNTGLRISLNGVPLQMRDLVFNISKDIKPVLKVREFKTGRHPVNVKIIAGLTDSVPQDAGWYVFCNGRMLLEREKTQLTGWGEREDGKVPRYHQQYARFRGYVFFDSDDAELLPWNTTKTGVDVDSPIYQSVRLDMINIMRPIIDFLNELKESKGENEDENSELDQMVSSTKATKIENINPGMYTPTFETPTYKKKEKSNMVRIIYSVPIDQAEVVKKSLGAKSWKEVGEQTFAYYLKLEGEY